VEGFLLVVVEAFLLEEVALVGHFVADAVLVQHLVDHFVVVEVCLMVDAEMVWVMVIGAALVIDVVLAGLVTVEVIVEVTTGGVVIT
jgi:hypothetical protein